MDLANRIGQTAGVEPEKVCEVVTLALEEFHRLTIVDEKGPTAAVMEACFAFGADAAFHLMGFLFSEHDYHGRNDEGRIWNEVAMRFIPEAYRKGCERIAPWFSEKTPARVSLDKAAVIDQQGFFDNEGRFAIKLEFPSASAVAIARAIRRVARKYGDVDLAKAAKELHSRATEATKNQQTVLNDSDDALPASRAREEEEASQGDLFSDRKKPTLDPLAMRYAEEHERFLRENKPAVLRGLHRSGDLDSYLSSVGEQAAERFEMMMRQYANSPKVQNLPHAERVQALQSAREEAEEFVRHDIINQLQ